jgi:hypothetical protein
VAWVTGLPIGSSTVLASLILLFLPRRDQHRKGRRNMLVALIVVSTLGFITGCGSGASLTSAATQPPPLREPMPSP